MVPVASAQNAQIIVYQFKVRPLMVRMDVMDIKFVRSTADNTEWIGKQDGLSLGWPVLMPLLAEVNNVAVLIHSAIRTAERNDYWTLIVHVTVLMSIFASRHH